MKYPYRRDSRCEGCGMRYGSLRTGMTFSGVAQAMKTFDPESYREVRRRRTILGFWRSLKVMMWEQHVGECTV